MTEKQPKHVDATFYAVVEPQWGRYSWEKDDQGRPILVSAKVDRITQTRPKTIKGDAILTRLTLRIDSAALLPLQPQAVIHIHADDVEVIEVVAEQPESDEAQ